MGENENIENHRVIYRARVHGLHVLAHRVRHRDLEGRNVCASAAGRKQKKNEAKKTDLAVALHCDLQKRKCNERAESKEVYVLHTSAAQATRMRAASRAFPCFSCACLFLLDHVQEHIRNTQVLYLHSATNQRSDAIP